MIVDTAQLHEFFYNLILFTARKSYAGPFIEIEFNGTSIFGRATTDIDCIETMVHTDGTAWRRSVICWISLDSAKETEKWLRGLSGKIEIGGPLGGPDIICLSSLGDIRLTNPTNLELWDETRDLLKASVDLDADIQYTFAVAPERLRKYSLLKPGDYPIDFIHDGFNLRWKAGPRSHGVIAPLDREVLFKKFKSEDVLW